MSLKGAWVISQHPQTGCWSEPFEQSRVTKWHRKKKLIQWSRDKGENYKFKIQARLKGLEMNQMSKAFENTMQQQELLKADLDTLWKEEEIYWCQRSHVNWLSAGDKSTHFFHLSTIQRRQQNRVVSPKNERGIWLSS